MSGPTIFSRRKFLQQTGALSAVSLAGSLDLMGLSSASAQSAGATIEAIGGCTIGYSDTFTVASPRWITRSSAPTSRFT